MRLSPLLLGGILLSGGIWYWSQSIDKQAFTPPAIRRADYTPLVPEDGKRRPVAWDSLIHRTAPGDDWRAIEARSLQSLIQGRDMHIPEITGTWAERGPANVPGRITDIDIDYIQGHVYALSDYGLVFRSGDLSCQTWSSLNDHHPLGLGTGAKMKVLPGAQPRIVVAGWQKTLNAWGIFYSDDLGAAWVQPTGLDTYPLMGIRRMLFQGDTAYVFVQEYDPALGRDYYTVYRSADRAGAFSVCYRSPIPAGDGGRHGKSDMWLPDNATHPTLYLALEDSLFLVDKQSGLRQFGGLIGGDPTLWGCLLTGREHQGVVELRAWTGAQGLGRFYAWSSLTSGWTHQGDLVEWYQNGPFGDNSFSCSRRSADTLYFGSILLSRSTDGGATWTLPDMDPTGSYALYHGDVPKTLSIINPLSSKAETWMGTDGGIYKRDAATDHFVQQGVPGVNCTQIYKMVTTQARPGEMYIGTQDNGYAITALGSTQPQAVDFTGVWGGDVTNMASGDGGETFWVWWWGEGCNYVTQPLTSGVSSTWSPYLQNGRIDYWEAPIWVSTHRPDVCYTAGYLHGGSGSHLLRVQAVPGTDAVGTELPYDFQAVANGRITAIAISPVDSNYWYVGTENGYLFSSTDAGLTWTQRLMSPYLYVRTIYPSHLDRNQVWVGGSGYSNAPVYYSADHGLTVSPFDTGMPACLVEALAASDDETQLFAASSIAPFVYENGGWSLIPGNAPLVHYMDVEYLSASRTVRFATYARGIWDFTAETSARNDALSLSSLAVFPNPARHQLTLRWLPPLAGPVQVELMTLHGQAVWHRTWGQAPDHAEIPVDAYPAGRYILRVTANGRPETRMIEIR
ncbi:MAG: T9SS type A sorting domain-containing protein [Bacteroidia bacterium]|nr:T9SS type A sorting domain-containing protein [Bacteroidia bacterium]